MKSRGFPGGKRSPPGDSGGVPPGNPLDMDISAARTCVGDRVGLSEGLDAFRVAGSVSLFEARVGGFLFL